MFMVSSKSLILITAILLCSSAAFAEPCPPKRFFCWQVKSLAALYGAGPLENHVRACGWTEIEINRAKRCLK